MSRSYLPSRTSRIVAPDFASNFVGLFGLPAASSFVEEAAGYNAVGSGVILDDLDGDGLPDLAGPAGPWVRFLDPSAAAKSLQNVSLDGGGAPRQVRTCH